MTAVPEIGRVIYDAGGDWVEVDVTDDLIALKVPGTVVVTL